MLPLKMNAQSALSALAMLVAIAGIGICAASYLAFFFFLQNAQAALLPQVDSAIGTMDNLQAVALPSAQSASNASAALASASEALEKYAQVSANLSSSLSSIAAVPPFSLDARFQSAASGMQQASAGFAAAGQGMNSTASSVSEAAAAARRVSEGISSAKDKLSAAKSSLQSAFFMLNAAALAALLSLGALFSSVILASASSLVSQKKNSEAANEKGKEREK